LDEGKHVKRSRFAFASTSGDYLNNLSEVFHCLALQTIIRIKIGEVDRDKKKENSIKECKKVSCTQKLELKKVFFSFHIPQILGGKREEEKPGTIQNYSPNNQED
jgi:hypothetical protein